MRDVAENGFTIRRTRPRPRACKRFMTRLLADTRPRRRSARRRRGCGCSRHWRWPTASTFLHVVGDTLLREGRGRPERLSTFLPRISAATRFSFCGELRSICARQPAPRYPSRGGGIVCLAHGLLPLGLLVGGVTVDRSASAKIHRTSWPIMSSLTSTGMCLLAVVDAEGQTDELRQDGGATRPDLDRRRCRPPSRAFSAFLRR